MSVKMQNNKLTINRKTPKPERVEARRIVINSFDDLNRLHERESQERRQYRANQLAQAVQATQALRQPAFNRLTGNTGPFPDALRSNWFTFLLDGPKDIDAECGYPHWLTPDHYRLMYDREGIAKRVVECEPEETWAEDPEVVEDEDESVDTKFEKAWEDFNKKHNAWYYLQRADVLSGIGQFGILLLGIDDGDNLSEPVDGINDDGTSDNRPGDYELLYLRPFSEEVVFIKTRDVDVASPRYGQPTMYRIQFRDFPNWGIQAGEIISRDVHWTRVIHVADNRKISEIYGIPRMQQVWNRLFDLRKIYSSAGEAFWKGAFPGLAFELNPEIAETGEPLDKESLKKEMDAYSNGLQRYIAVTGLTTKSLPPMITDPTGTAECMLKAIAIAKGIPYRVLFGSEEAKLAGAQDDRHWNKKLGKRQEKYVAPMLIRPFVDRLIALGVLPAPKDDYEIVWPDLDTPTDADKVALALQTTQALQAYVQGGVDALIPPEQYLTKVLSFSPEDAEAIMDAAQEHMDDGLDDQIDDENSGNADEGALGSGGDDQPDDGNAMRQPNLSGSTTVPKNKKPVGAQFTQMPSLNRKKSPKQAKAVPNANAALESPKPCRNTAKGGKTPQKALSGPAKGTRRAKR